MTEPQRLLPDWSVDRWFNTPRPISLADLGGKIVVIEAFQMLCPGCVAHGLPLAQKLHDLLPPEDVAVIGLHTVFEHHAAMTPVSLEAFLREYGITFPVGVDTPGADRLPVTMERYGLRGTPSLLVLDRAGAPRVHHFGQVDPLRLGIEIGMLVSREEPLAGPAASAVTTGCDTSGCEVPEF